MHACPQFHKFEESGDSRRDMVDGSVLQSRLLSGLCAWRGPLQGTHSEHLRTLRSRIMNANPCDSMLLIAQECCETGGCAWKSIAVCHSYDNGCTWTKPELIITSAVKRPDKPSWGGSGDFSVIKVPSAVHVWCMPACQLFAAHDLVQQKFTGPPPPLRPRKEYPL